MRIARYVDKRDNSTRRGELYVDVVMTDAEYVGLGRPSHVNFKVDGSMFVLKGGNVGPAPSARDQRDGRFWQFRINSPVFPTTKPFGMEEVNATIVDGVLLAEVPTQKFEVIERGAREKPTPAASGLLAELQGVQDKVNALNALRKSFKGIVFSLDADGYIAAEVRIS